MDFLGVVYSIGVVLPKKNFFQFAIERVATSRSGCLRDVASAFFTGFSAGGPPSAPPADSRGRPRVAAPPGPAECPRTARARRVFPADIPPIEPAVGFWSRPINLAARQIFSAVKSLHRKGSDRVFRTFSPASLRVCLTRRETPRNKARNTIRGCVELYNGRWLEL